MHVTNFLAYLDPGTGSLIIQSLIGAAAGVAVFGRRTLISLKQKFKGSKSDESSNQAVSPAEATKSQPKKSDDTKK
jgi:hypothetical protein